MRGVKKLAAGGEPAVAPRPRARPTRRGAGAYGASPADERRRQAGCCFARLQREELGPGPSDGRSAGGEAGEAIGCNPSAAGERLQPLGDIRGSDLEMADDLGDGLVTKLADRTVLVAGMVVMPDGRDGRGTDQRDRQYHDPGAPARATPCEGARHHCWMAVPGAVGLSIHGERLGPRPPQQANPRVAAPAHESGARLQWRRTTFLSCTRRASPACMGPPWKYHCCCQVNTHNGEAPTGRRTSSNRCLRRCVFGSGDKVRRLAYQGAADGVQAGSDGATA